MTITGCLIILYFCWRIWGIPLATVGFLAFLYFFFGEGLPGILGHAGMDLAMILLPNYGSTRATV